VVEYFCSAPVRPRLQYPTGCSRAVPGADNVSEKLDLIGELRALFQDEGSPGFLEMVKNRVKVFDVLFRVCGEDDDIV